MQSILRNYMAWIVMAVLMIGFLVIQFALVESRRARTMQENKKPVDTLKQAETMRRGDGSLPTEGDLRAAVALQTGVRIGHRDIVQDLRRFSCGLDAYMAGDPNNEPNDALRGSKTLEIMRPGTGIPGPAGSGKRVDVEPIPWSMFAVTLRRLYDDMVEESRRLLLKAREKRLREALADQYFAADRLMTREKADEHAAVVARAEAERQVDALLAGARDLNPIRGGIDERYNPSDESHLARGWNNWRRYLVMRDLLLDVLPTAMAEVDATYWAANPVDEGQRERYVKHFMADDGDRQPPSDIVMTPASVRWERKTARFIDSFRVEGLDLAPEVGNVALPSRADMERPEPPKIPDSGQAFDRYRLTFELTGHAAAINAFTERLLDARRGMLYTPVSTEIMPLSGGAATASTPSRGSRGGGGDTPSSGSVDATPRFDYEPPVRARLVFHLYRFRFGDTYNERPAPTPRLGE